MRITIKSLINYLKVINWTCRAIRENMRETLPAQTPTLLRTFGLNRKTLLRLANDFGKRSPPNTTLNSAGVKYLLQHKWSNIGR